MKFTYGLWVTDAEQVAMVTRAVHLPATSRSRGLGRPELPAPSRPGTRADAAPPAPAPAPAPAVEPAPAPVVEQAPAPAPAPVPAPAPAPVDVYYENCDAARAAGAAPVYRGDPGYAKKLDRDGDGVGCE